MGVAQVNAHPGWYFSASGDSGLPAAEPGLPGVALRPTTRSCRVRKASICASFALIWSPVSTARSGPREPRGCVFWVERDARTQSAAAGGVVVSRGPAMMVSMNPFGAGLVAAGRDFAPLLTALLRCFVLTAGVAEAGFAPTLGAAFSLPVWAIAPDGAAKTHTKTAIAPKIAMAIPRPGASRFVQRSGTSLKPLLKAIFIAPICPYAPS